MKIGIDTTLLVQAEIIEHPGHDDAHLFLEGCLHRGELFALSGQVIQEFIHIVTDPDRFERPLSVDQAVRKAQQWWNAEEVVPVSPKEITMEQFFSWMIQFGLGRKRILDTMLAATYFTNDVFRIASANTRDFSVFGVFDLIRL